MNLLRRYQRAFMRAHRGSRPSFDKVRQCDRCGQFYKTRLWGTLCKGCVQGRKRRES